MGKIQRWFNVQEILVLRREIKGYMGHKSYNIGDLCTNISFAIRITNVLFPLILYQGLFEFQIVNVFIFMVSTESITSNSRYTIYDLMYETYVIEHITRTVM